MFFRIRLASGLHSPKSKSRSESRTTYTFCIRGAQAHAGLCEVTFFKPTPRKPYARAKRAEAPTGLCEEGFEDADQKRSIGQQSEQPIHRISKWLPRSSTKNSSRIHQQSHSVPSSFSGWFCSDFPRSRKQLFPRTILSTSQPRYPQRPGNIRYVRASIFNVGFGQILLESLFTNTFLGALMISTLHQHIP